MKYFENLNEESLGRVIKNHMTNNLHKFTGETKRIELAAKAAKKAGVKKGLKIGSIGVAGLVGAGYVAKKYIDHKKMEKQNAELRRYKNSTKNKNDEED
jgi:hypothetical protein